MVTFKPLDIYTDIKTIKLRCYGLTFQSPTIHSIFYFYLGPLRPIMLYQWRRFSTTLWIERTVHSRYFFYNFPSSHKEVTLMQMYLSMFSCLSWERCEIMYCQAFIMLLCITLCFSLLAESRLGGETFRGLSSSWYTDGCYKDWWTQIWLGDTKHIWLSLDSFTSCLL